MASHFDPRLPSVTRRLQVLDFSPDKSKVLFRGPVKMHVLTFVDAKAPYVAGIRATLEQLAGDHRGTLLHVVVGSTEDKIMSYFGVEKSELPRTVSTDCERAACTGALYRPCNRPPTRDTHPGLARTTGVG